MSRLSLYFSAKVVFLGGLWNFSVGIFGGYKKRAAMVAALCVVRSKSLVYNHGGEVFLEELFGTLELLAGVLLHLFELILPAHGLPLVYTKAVVGEYLDTLYLLVLAEGFAQGADILLHVAVAGHEHVAQPEGVVVLFEPGCSAQGLLVAAARELAMALGVELLDIEQHEVDLGEEFLDVLVPHTAIGVDAGVYAVALEILYYRYEGLGLYGGLATREGDTATLAEEGLLVDRHVDDVLGTGSLAAIEVDGVWVCTIEATEGTAL